MATYSILAYADNNSEVKEKKVDQSRQQSDGSNGDDRGNSDPKITLCHVPPGNPKDKHTIHIAFSAWSKHQGHENDKGPDFVDYLGSCNSKVTSEKTSVETLHVISGCTGTARNSLVTKIQDFFEPITVADSALDDESVVTAMSQCLDNGDSGSDSGHGNSPALIKGGGHDSVSDSGNHHRVRGCQDNGTVTYNKTLKIADTDLDESRHTKDPIIVSDSSLNDKDVFKSFKDCVSVSNSNKIDSGKVTKKLGEAGHQQQILKDPSCTTSQDGTLRTAVTNYKAKASTKDLVLTADSYNDVEVKKAVEACVAAGAKDSITDSFSPTIALHKVKITGATVINVKTDGNGNITEGHITAGTSETAHVVGGEISGGAYTGGALVGTTLTGATITDATVYSGVSGRLSFRENTSPR